MSLLAFTLTPTCFPPPMQLGVAEEPATAPGYRFRAAVALRIAVHEAEKLPREGLTLHDEDVERWDGLS